MAEKPVIEDWDEIPQHLREHQMALLQAIRPGWQMHDDDRVYRLIHKAINVYCDAEEMTPEERTYIKSRAHTLVRYRAEQR